ncbi:hypothetical protein BWI17_21480 [Betaproteobacteria bacterium GR16-43]|nr:hypothetical protein BWI17_21480 [Betaproteobacteria bacterium GR16-43]
MRLLDKISRIFALAVLTMVLGCAPKPESPARFSGMWKGEGASAGGIELTLAPEGKCTLMWYTGWERHEMGCTSYSIDGQTLTLTMKDQAPAYLRFDSRKQVMTIQVGQTTARLTRIDTKAAQEQSAPAEERGVR